MINHSINFKLIQNATSKYSLKKAVNNELKKFNQSLNGKSIIETKAFFDANFDKESPCCKIINAAVERLQQLN